MDTPAMDIWTLTITDTITGPWSCHSKLNASVPHTVAHRVTYEAKACGVHGGPRHWTLDTVCSVLVHPLTCSKLRFFPVFKVEHDSLALVMLNEFAWMLCPGPRADGTREMGRLGDGG